MFLFCLDSQKAVVCIGNKLNINFFQNFVPKKKKRCGLLIYF